MSKSTNKNFINSYLPWLKGFRLITLKSDIWSKYSCICHTKLLPKRAGFTVLCGRSLTDQRRLCTISWSYSYYPIGWMCCSFQFPVVRETLGYWIMVSVAPSTLQWYNDKSVLYDKTAALASILLHLQQLLLFLETKNYQYEIS